MQNKSKVLLAISVIVLLISVFPVYVDASVEEKTGDIGYDSLSEDQQKVYDLFKMGVEKRASVIPLLVKGISPTEFQVVMYAYMSDHPENFWASYFDSYLESRETIIYVESSVEIEKLNIDSMSAEINEVVSSFTVTGDSLPDRVKCIHDFIAKKASYDLSTTNCGNIYGALVEGKCKCDGYSLAMDFLCKQKGIKNIVVEIGKMIRENEGHAWNIIMMDDDKWYYLDLTGDDGDHSIRYDYFLIGSTTDTPTGSISSARDIYFDYHLIVSKDRYDYDPYNLMSYVPYFVAILIVILIAILILYLLFRRHESKVREQYCAEPQANGRICPQCGANTSPEDTFCRQCGNMIAEKETEEVSEVGPEQKE